MCGSYGFNLTRYIPMQLQTIEIQASGGFIYRSVERSSINLLSLVTPCHGAGTMHDTVECYICRNFTVARPASRRGFFPSRSRKSHWEICEKRMSGYVPDFRH